MKRYRLTLLFVLAALATMAAGIAVASLIVGRLATNNLIRATEDEASRDSRHLLTMLSVGLTSEGRPQGDSGTQTGPSEQPLTLAFLASPEGLPSVIPLLPPDFSVMQWNLFTPDGVIVWSTDPARIGEVADDPAFKEIEISGRPYSKFERGRLLVDTAGVQRLLDEVETYLPIRVTPSGDIIGVLELYRDVTQDVASLVDNTRSTVLWTMSGTLGSLFLVVLGFIVTADVALRRSSSRETALAEARLTERQRADMAAMALREQQEQLRLAQEKATLAEIGRILSSSTQVDRLCGSFMQEMCKLIPCDRGVIEIADTGDQPWTTVHTCGLNGPEEPTRLLPALEPLREQALQARAAVLVQATDEQEIASRSPALVDLYRGGFRSLLAVPLIAADQVAGVMHLLSTTPDAYSAQEIDLARNLGAQLGGAITATRFAEQRRQMEDLVLELSLPVLRIEQHMLLLPIIGALDGERVSRLMAKLLAAIRTHRAKVVIIDVTGIAHMDSYVAGHMIEAVEASRLLGATVILTGISAAVSGILVKLGVDLGKVRTIGDLENGIEEARRLLSTGSPPAPDTPRPPASTRLRKRPLHDSAHGEPVEP